MATTSSTKGHIRSRLASFRLSVRQFLTGLPRVCQVTLLVGFLWLPGWLASPALALSINSAVFSGQIPAPIISSAPEADHLNALITCLPTELSQPSLKRALSEMRNDQFERALNLKASPKLSKAEVALATCLNSQGS